MIQQTLDRLRGLAPVEDALIVTNRLLVDTIKVQLPDVPDSRILIEPAARNTAPACALAAMIAERYSPKSVLGIFPSDHVVGNLGRFHQVMRAGVALAACGDNIVVFGAPPTRAETGYGYIERGAPRLDVQTDERVLAYDVRRFTEKPDSVTATRFFQDSAYSWNSGIFMWSAKTLADAIRQFCPEMAHILQQIADAYGHPHFARVYEDLYPLCESISIDYAVLEPVSRKHDSANIICLPADFGWNDLGSWTALHEHKCDELPSRHLAGNIVEAPHSVLLDATGNYVSVPGFSVALLGVHDLVVVQTEDALLVTTRPHSQNVGRIVEELVQSKRFELL